MGNPKISTNCEYLLSEGTVPVPPRTAPALVIVLYYLLRDYRFREDGTAAGSEALRAVAQKEH
jgi:hypothetical protein